MTATAHSSTTTTPTPTAARTGPRLSSPAAVVAVVAVAVVARVQRPRVVRAPGSALPSVAVAASIGFVVDDAIVIDGVAVSVVGALDVWVVGVSVLVVGLAESDAHAKPLFVPLQLPDRSCPAGHRLLLHAAHAPCAAGPAPRRYCPGWHVVWLRHPAILLYSPGPQPAAARSWSPKNRGTRRPAADGQHRRPIATACPHRCRRCPQQLPRDQG